MPADAPVPLPLTGERTVPDVAVETYWFARHVVAYRLATDIVARAGTGGTPLRVVDAGCGEGYGLELLERAGAAHVVGLEIDDVVADHARRRYAEGHGRVEVLTHDLDAHAAPGLDGGFDLVISFQLIEPVAYPEADPAAVARLARPGATILITTPNRLTLSPGRDTPLNPFHVREFSPRELARLVDHAGIGDVVLAGVHHGRRLTAAADAAGRDLLAALTSGAPEDWPDWLATLVPTVTPDDFVVGEASDDCLDVVAVVTLDGDVATRA